MKFTKRLSVRLAAVSAVLALGALGIAQTLIPTDEPDANTTNDAAGQQSSADEKQLTPLPDEGGSVAESSSPADPQTEGPTASHASFEQEIADDEPSYLPVTVPSPSETVRANDDGESASVSLSAPPDPNALAADLGRGGAYAPPSSTTPEISPAGGSVSPSLDTPPASGNAAPSSEPAAPAAEEPNELSPSLRDAARTAIGDSTAVGGANDMGSGAAPAPSTATITTPGISPPTQVQNPSVPESSPSADSSIAEASNNMAATDAPPGSSYQSAAALASGPVDGEGVPGVETMDGLQSPSLTVEKTAPAEIQVGKETTFELTVRNVGNVAAHDVIVLDRVPRGTRFVNATPTPSRAPDGQLMWQLATLQPGDEAIVSVQLLPLAEGEIGSVAQVLFQTHASVRTTCTKPELTLSHTGPQRVLIGETVTFDITVSNPGTGEATGVVLEENVPEGLAHIAGNELINEMGTLKPGETRRVKITLKADKAGIVDNVLLVRGDGNLIVRDSFQMEVIAPTLQVALNGPSLRFLEREAIYEVAVANTGTATAREVELVTYLPKGMKYVSADHKGQYEPQNHAVYWSLEELPPEQTGVAKLALMPVETGEQKLNLEGRAELGLQHTHEKLVQVDSFAELQFTISDVADPIEVGTETTYMITLTNTGSSAATNIQLAVELPPDIRPVGGEGPTRVVINGTQVLIDPLARLAPGEQTAYRLKVRGLAAGPQRIQVQLETDETQVPVTKEEITRVYSDHSS